MTAQELLAPPDLDRFEQIGVGAELLTAAQVRRVTTDEARQLYGICFNGDLSGIVFPYVNPVSGDRATARIRRDNPELDADGKPENKYVSAFGDNRHLYFPPYVRELLDDASVPVVFVEAEKSALALTALGARHGRRLLAIATGGVGDGRGMRREFAKRTERSARRNTGATSGLRTSGPSEADRL